MTIDTEPRTPHRRGGRIVWGVIIAGLVFLVVAFVFASRFGTDPTLSDSPLIDEPAPDGRITLLDGPGTVSLDDYLGDIVVVNFWASWCTPCQAEHGVLTAAATDYDEFDTTFLSVNYQDEPERAEQFLDQLGRSGATVYAIDETSETAFEWGVLGLPETYFVDREGIVVGKVTGPVSYELLSRTIDQILLGETVGAITTGDVENR